MSKISVYITLLAVVLACNNTQSPSRTIAREPNVVTEYPVPKENTHSELNLTGTYKGLLPCADCGGIEVTLTLAANDRYVLKTRHISDEQAGKDIEAEYEGKYSWNDDLNVVTLHDIINQPNQYKYRDGTLIQLDIKGNMIDGPLADKYILRK